MAELIVNDLVQHGKLKQWIVFVSEDTVSNYRTVFGEKGVRGINMALKKFPTSEFYEIKRYYQFVGILSYRPFPHPFLSMSLFESDDMDTFLDSFLELQNKKWKDADLKQIGDIMQKIINDNEKELATIRKHKVL